MKAGLFYTVLAGLIVAGGAMAPARQGCAAAKADPVGTEGLGALLPVRLASYNIENFDASPGDLQFNAAAAVLKRIAADVVCVQEMMADDSFVELAREANYPFRVLADTDNALDGYRVSGVMSKHPIIAWSVLGSVDLSGDPNARDITRNFVMAEVRINGAQRDLVAICNHWWPTNDDEGEFVRSVESIRAMQVASAYDSAVVPYVVAGDINDDLADSPDVPPYFFELPSGLPAHYSLGRDLVLPIDNGAFVPLERGHGPQALKVADALQLDGSAATHVYGKRYDYVWLSAAVKFIAAEVYDSEDEGLGGGLPKAGSPLPRPTSAVASDHLLVFADVQIARGEL